jgi:hypothetical protein
MIPYTINLTRYDEVPQIQQALKIAICLAKESGTDAEIEQLKAAYEMLENHEVSGGYESQEERNAAYMLAAVQEYKQYGSD